MPLLCWPSQRVNASWLKRPATCGCLEESLRDSSSGIVVENVGQSGYVGSVKLRHSSMKMLCNQRLHSMSAIRLFEQSAVPRSVARIADYQNRLRRGNSSMTSRRDFEVRCNRFCIRQSLTKSFPSGRRPQPLIRAFS